MTKQRLASRDRVGSPALALAALATVVATVTTQAAESATACRFARAETAVVARVIDGRRFVLDDGRETRLSSIEVPPVLSPGEPGATAGAAARAALAALIAGRPVVLHSASEVVDRYGRHLAHVFVGENGAERLVAADLLAQGHARVAARVEDRACATALLTYESAARAQNLGLWADPQYHLREAANGTALLAERGRFVVAEGKVASVRESGGTIYVNFGRRWSEALTVTISKRNKPTLAAAGKEPKGLENRLVRVRGWVEARNGPRIEVLRPEQIEIADRN